MKRPEILSIWIALLTLPIVLMAWQLDTFLEGLNRSRYPLNPDAIKKLSMLERGLRDGSIKLQPPDRTKTAIAAAQIARSSLLEPKGFSSEIGLIEIFLDLSIVIFAAQLVAAVGNAWWKWRSLLPPREHSSERPPNSG